MDVDKKLDHTQQIVAVVSLSNLWGPGADAWLSTYSGLTTFHPALSRKLLPHRNKPSIGVAAEYVKYHPKLVLHPFGTRFKKFHLTWLSVVYCAEFIKKYFQFDGMKPASGVEKVSGSKAPLKVEIVKRLE